MTYEDGQQKNTMSQKPYTPGLLDARHAMPTGTPLTKDGGFPRILLGQSNIVGM